MSNYSYVTVKTIKTYDGEIIVYDPSSSMHYFGEEVYANIMSLTPEEKHRWFTIHKEHEDLILKTYGNNIDEETLENLGHGYSLAVAERTFPVSEDELLEEYREWLKTQ